MTFDIRIQLIYYRRPNCSLVNQVKEGIRDQQDVYIAESDDKQSDIHVHIGIKGRGKGCRNLTR